MKYYSIPSEVILPDLLFMHVILFHISAAMYDCFAALDETADSYLIEILSIHTGLILGVLKPMSRIHLKKL